MHTVVRTFKINSVTKASQLLPKVGKECKGLNDDVGAKAWYLIGKSFERKKMWKEAAEAYQKIPEMYPEHSMADDGYALAGIGFKKLEIWTLPCLCGKSKSKLFLKGTWWEKVIGA